MRQKSFYLAAGRFAAVGILSLAVHTATFTIAATAATAAGTPAASPPVAASGPVAGTTPIAGSGPVAPSPTAAPSVVAGGMAPTTAAASATTQVGAAATQAGANPPPPAQSPWSYVFLVVAGIAIFYMLLGRPAREEKKRKAMISALKRGDRVVTTSGLLASVVEVKENEVILKIDESANVKSHYTRSSILSVIEKADASDDK